jgi:hypothetical protein
MHTISKSEATEIAAARVCRLEQEAGCKLELLDLSTVQVKEGWVFFYNSADFIRTGNTSDALAGNGPLFVTLEGSLVELPSSKPWQRALEELKYAPAPHRAGIP